MTLRSGQAASIARERRPGPGPSRVRGSDGSPWEPILEAMQKRRLGTRGPEVSAVGLGCMGTTSSYGPFPTASR